MAKTTNSRPSTKSVNRKKLASSNTVNSNEHLSFLDEKIKEKIKYLVALRDYADKAKVIDSNLLSITYNARLK